jgi:hypothetical protein
MLDLALNMRPKLKIIGKLREIFSTIIFSRLRPEQRGLELDNGSMAHLIRRTILSGMG